MHKATISTIPTLVAADHLSQTMLFPLLIEGEEILYTTVNEAPYLLGLNTLRCDYELLVVVAENREAVDTLLWKARESGLTSLFIATERLYCLADSGQLEQVWPVVETVLGWTLEMKRLIEELLVEEAERTFTVELVNPGQQTDELAVIIQEVIGISLKTAQWTVKSRNVLLDSKLSWEEAEAMRNKLEAAGATVEVRPERIEKVRDE